MKFSLLVLIIILNGVLMAQSPIESPILNSWEEWQNLNSTENWKNYHFSSTQKAFSKVVSINNGHCSGSIISSNGHILTNYHCFFDHFARLDNTLKENGFYAKDKSKSIPLEGVEIEILDTAIEISTSIPKLQFSSTEIINRKIDSILNSMESINGFRYLIKKFESQDRYFLIRYRIFSDISLISMPPENAANFGGQNTNWQWPRYAMDFCIIKVNDTTNYKFESFDIAKSIIENEKVINVSYPALTNRNASSVEIDYKINFENKIRSLIREARLYILKEEIYFQKDLPGKYNSMYSDISNYKLFIEGESKLLNEMKFVMSRNEFENTQSKSNQKLEKCLVELDKLYDQLRTYNQFRLYLNEAIVAPEIFLFSFKFNVLLDHLKSKDQATISKTTSRLIEATKIHFSDYNLITDNKMFFKMLEIYDKSLPDSLKPEFLKQKKLEFKNDLYVYTQNIFDNTIFNSEYKLLKFLEAPKANILESDAAFEFVSQFIEHYFTKIAPKINEFNEKISLQNLIYRQNITNSETDANGTLMLSTGYIEGYEIDHTINYNYITQLQDWNLNNGEKTKILSPKFQESINKMDSMPLCFIASLDVTSGSSGSPVVNEEGKLLGLVFDQNPEGMSNQFLYNSKIQRGQCLNVNVITEFIKAYFNVDFQEQIKKK